MRAGWLVIPCFSWYKPTYDVRVICPPNFHNFPPFCSIFIRTPCQYLAGKRVFSPCDQEIPNQGILERSMWQSEILLVATRVDPTRVGGGQLSLPGVSWYKPTYNVMGPLRSHAQAVTIQTIWRKKVSCAPAPFSLSSQWSHLIANNASKLSKMSYLAFV